MKTCKGTECFQGNTLCLISLYQSKLSLLAQEIHVPNCHYQSCGLQERGKTKQQEILNDNWE